MSTSYYHFKTGNNFVQHFDNDRISVLNE